MSSYQYEGIFIGLGANVGAPVFQLRSAWAHLHEKGVSVIRASSLYKTPPWGNTKQPEFINQVLQVTWSDSGAGPLALMLLLLSVETSMGRVRAEKNGPRIIDLDLLAFNQLVWKEEMLTLPHPQVLRRAFVLVPWVEIAPTFWLSDSAQTVEDALAKLPIEEVIHIQKLNYFFKPES